MHAKTKLGSFKRPTSFNYAPKWKCQHVKLTTLQNQKQAPQFQPIPITLGFQYKTRILASCSPRNQPGQHNLFHTTNPNLAKKDYYEILGVSKGASQGEIKKAFYDAAKKYHPDSTKGDKEKLEKFKEITAAYEVLGDEQKRKQYDQFGHMAFEGGGGGGPEGGVPEMDLEELFSRFGIRFGDFAGGPDMGMKPRAPDIHFPVKLTFMEAVHGCEKEIKVVTKAKCSTCDGSGAKPGSKLVNCSKCKGSGFVVESRFRGAFQMQSTCPQCDGEGRIPADTCTSCKGKGAKQEIKTHKVKIPPGVDNGMAIRVASAGHFEKGYSPGDLFVQPQVAEDPLFKRNGYDVTIEVPLTISQALLGGSISIPTLDGKEIEMMIPTGIQPYDKRVLKGKGIHRPNSYDRGNLYIFFKILLPSKLSPKQKDAIKQFQQEEEPNEEVKEFQSKVREFFRKSS